MNAKRTMLTAAMLAIGGLLAMPAAGLARDRDDHHRPDRLIDQLRNDRDDDDRREAAEDLGDLNLVVGLPALRESAAFDKSEKVRDEARASVYKLERLAGPEIPFRLVPERGREARELSWRLLYSADGQDRARAAVELARRDEQRATDALIFASTHDPDGGARQAAHDAVVRITGRAVYQPMPTSPYYPQANATPPVIVQQPVIVQPAPRIVRPAPIIRQRPGISINLNLDFSNRGRRH